MRKALKYMNLANRIYWLASARRVELEESKLRKAYRELALRGGDIVNVVSYRCVRDSDGAPDTEYALFSPSNVLPIAEEAKRVLSLVYSNEYEYCVE
ncbi:MAG: hypothetical protein DRJ63_09645 [Thermoprotei archaeon]|nr:MAG: hypothetical protein DRJ63_09645 [Thermoprotei archaeon]